MNISIVIPCLNESETLQICLDKIKKQIYETKLKAEIIVADNGSSDGSLEIAKKNNVKIINVTKKGYGYAIRAGIDASVGEYILIADADNSYDFNELSNFYNKINVGFDIVQGCRLPSGGGKIEKDAMPVTHRLIGNPFFSFISRILFKLPFNDVYCGMKIIRREFFEKIDFFSGGMVWCLEILVKSKVNSAKSSELSITLHKDGRINGKSHLRTISDGLRTIKFILTCSPKWIYILPSILLLLIPTLLIIYFFINGNFFIFINNNLINLFTSTFIGLQLLILGLYVTLRAETLGLTKGGQLNKFFNFFTLKKSLIINFFIIIIINYLYLNDLLYFLKDFNKNIFAAFSSLMSINIIFSSFFISLLRINK